MADDMVLVLRSALSRLLEDLPWIRNHVSFAECIFCGVEIERDAVFAHTDSCPLGILQEQSVIVTALPPMGER